MQFSLSVQDSIFGIIKEDSFLLEELLFLAKIFALIKMEMYFLRKNFAQRNFQGCFDKSKQKIACMGTCMLAQVHHDKEKEHLRS